MTEHTDDLENQATVDIEHKSDLEHMAGQGAQLPLAVDEVRDAVTQAPVLQHGPARAVACCQHAAAAVASCHQHAAVVC